MASQRAIAQLGNPVLRQIAEPICDVHADWVQRLIDDLLFTLHQSQGVGIAAPQVSESHRLFIVASHPNARYPNAPQMEPTPMINPHIIERSDHTVDDWEGCLSIPGIRGLVPRHHEITVTYTDRHNQQQQQTLTGFVARIFQHELDHLDGKVFLDHVASSLDLMTDQEYLKRSSLQ
ncbi:MAG: peptide deformylase [Cyanobacteria bacterium P01_F01_bin.150]